jgi:uncharacterized membrane protein
MTGMLTGALMGAVMAGVWLLRRPPQPMMRRALASAGRLGPRAARMVRQVRRRLG